MSSGSSRADSAVEPNAEHHRQLPPLSGGRTPSRRLPDPGPWDRAAGRAAGDRCDRIHEPATMADGGDPHVAQIGVPRARSSRRDRRT